MDNSLRRIQQNVRSTATSCTQAFNGLANAFKGAIAAFSVAHVFNQITDNLKQTEKAVSSLTAVTGNLKTSRALFDELNNLSREIPQSFDEITQAALTLNKTGLKPTADTVKSLAAISLGTGQSLNTVAQAFGSAAMGRMRALQQLGITAVQEGDKIKLTYQGVTETIKADTASLTDYMNRLAENKFAETLNYQMQGVTGAVKVLGEAWGDLYRALGESAIGEMIVDSMRDVADILDTVTAKLKSPEWAENLKSIQVAFEALKDGVVSSFSVIADTWNQFIDGFEDSSKEGTDYAATYFQNFFKLVNIGIVGMITSLKEVVSFLPALGNTIGKAFSPDLKKKMAWSEWERKASSGEVNLNDAAGFKEFEKNYNVHGFSEVKSAGDLLADAGNRITDAMDKAAKRISDAGVEKARQIALNPSTSGVGEGNRPITSGTGGGKGGSGGGGGIDRQAQEAKRAFDQLAQSLERARVQALSALQKEQIEYQQHIATVTDALNRRVVSEQEAKTMLEQIETQHQENLNRIRLEADARLAEMRGDPIAKLQIQYAAELEELEKFHNDKIVSETEYLETMKAIYDRYYDEISKKGKKDKGKGKKGEENSIFGISAESLEKVKDSLDSVSGAFSNMTQNMDESSGAYKALFAVQKSFSVASATMSCIEAWANALKTQPFWPAGLAAYAQAVAMTANIIGQLTSVSMHDKGGNIPAGQYGIVGEIGPELVRGPASVTSRKDTAELLNRSGDVTVNLIEDRSRAGQVSDRETDEGRIIDICVANIRRGGDLADAVSHTYGLSRQGI
jgi:hypothetical protein